MTNLLVHLPPLNPFGAGHHYFMRGRSAGVTFRDTTTVVCVRATPVAVFPQFQVGYWESLCAKTWSQVFQGGDVLIHDLLLTQLSFIHSVLLEGPYKFRKHPPDPDFRQKVVPGYVFGKRFWNAV